MERTDFDKIVSEQEEILTDKDIIKYHMKAVKTCGFLNKGYDPKEYKVKPVKEYGEIRFLETNNTYSHYIKINEPIPEGTYGPKVWYGISGKFLIKNIGSDCQTMFLLK